jgi:hypothetical protein
VHGSQTGGGVASATVAGVGSTLAVSVLVVVETCSVLEGKRTPARRTDTSAAITIIWRFE